MFEAPPKLPEIEKKGRTEFEEFSLSRSNAHLAKKTLVEYLINKENTQIFRARSFDPNKLNLTPKSNLDVKKAQATQFSPFTF